MWRLALALSFVACNGDKDTDNTDTDPPVDTDSGLVQDVFVQTLTSPIDILWVVDPGWNEGMDALDEALEKGYETLLLADPSWRFGVLDATVEPGTARFGLIDAKFQTYPPPSNAFDLSAPDGPPRVRDSLYAALELRREHDANVEFLRSDASLYVLVYTNKEDDSADADVTRAEWRTWFGNLQPSEGKRLGALVDGGVTGYWENQVIGDATVFTAGSFRAGVSAQLREAMGQKTEFFLSQVPTAPLTEVAVVYRERKEIFEEPEVVFNNARNSIQFADYVPPPEAEIRVTYAGDGSQLTTPGTPTTPTPPAE